MISFKLKSLKLDTFQLSLKIMIEVGKFIMQYSKIIKLRFEFRSFQLKSFQLLVFPSALFNNMYPFLWKILIGSLKACKQLTGDIAVYVGDKFEMSVTDLYINNDPNDASATTNLQLSRCHHRRVTNIRLSPLPLLPNQLL